MIDLIRDDAAIIYLNGAEVARSHQQGATAFAAATDSYGLLVAGNEAAWNGGTTEGSIHRIALEGIWLDAENILAASVHNNILTTAIADSSDLGFRLTMIWATLK